MALTKEQWKDRAFAMERERDEARAELSDVARTLKWIGENSTDVPISDAAFQHLAALEEE